MVDFKFEDLFDFYIHKASVLGKINQLDENSMYYISSPKVLCFNQKIGQIIINLDKTINDLNLFFPNTIDKNFYHVISDIYGSTENIMIKDKLIYHESTKKTNDEFSSEISETSFSLKKRTLDNEKIDCIIWNKKKIRIKLYFNHDSNGMSIHFSKLLN